MNIFKLSDKAFEQYLKENIENKDVNILLKELIKCGLHIDNHKTTRLRHFKKWLSKNHPIIVYYIMEANKK